LISFLGFRTKILYSPLFSPPPPPSKCPVYLILLHFFAHLTFGEEYRLRSSLLCSHHHSPVTSSLLDPNILLSILFSNTLSLCSSIKMSDQVLHPYTTAGNIHSGVKRTHFFLPIIVNFYFQYKNIMLTPKQPVINAVLITYIDYSITENYIGKMASFLPYTSPEPLLKVLHHIY